MKAIANFMKIPFTPVENLDRLQQVWAPVVQNKFATESTAWLEKHKPAGNYQSLSSIVPTSKM